MKISGISLILMVLLFCQEIRVAEGAGSATCTVTGETTIVRYEAPSGTANNIEFVLSGEHTCYSFLNGDIGVVGPVTVVSIRPTHAAGCGSQGVCSHGWSFGLPGQPSSSGGQALDSRDPSFDSRYFGGEFPQTVSGPASIVKAVSDLENACPGNVSGQECLQFAAVLTILDEVPDTPSMMFRPPFYGKTATVAETKSWSDLNWSFVAKLDAASVPDRPAFREIARRFQEVQLEVVNDHFGRRFHPEDNFLGDEYHGRIGDSVAAAIMRFALDDFEPNNAEHRKSAASVLQYGYDLAWMYANGGRWGNHSAGRQAAAAFAAHLLGDTSLIAAVASTAHNDREYQLVYYSDLAGRALFGAECSEEQYWENQRTGGGSKFCRDPYGYIDGPDLYISCCFHGSIVAGSLAVRLSGIEATFNRPHVLEYGYRRYKFGFHAQPDPCLAASQGGGARGDGSCIQGSTSRSVDNESHGANADYIIGNVGMFHGFVQSMKAQFFDCAVQDGCGNGVGVVRPMPPVVDESE